jgi:hypothetical protein
MHAEMGEKKGHNTTLAYAQGELAPPSSMKAICSFSFVP